MSSRTAASIDDGASGARAGRVAAPPDTPTFTWGDATAAVEHLASVFVERSLEQAIADSRLRPGIPGWRAAAVDLCDAALDEPVTVLGLSGNRARSIELGATGPAGAGGVYPSIRQWIVLERVVDWVRRQGDAVSARAKQAIAGRVLSAPPMPSASVTEPMLAPMQWLLDACDPAAVLTSGQHLQKSLVIEGAERFGWQDPSRRPPQSEASVPQLVVLREVARRLGYVRRTGTALSATREGRLLIDDVRGLWRGMCRTLGNLEPFGEELATAIGLQLLNERTITGTGIDDIVRRVADAGWHVAGRPLGDRDIRRGVDAIAFWWRANGLLSRSSAGSSGDDLGATNSLQLTALGQSAVLTFLHIKATSPISASM